MPWWKQSPILDIFLFWAWAQWSTFLEIRLLVDIWKFVPLCWGDLIKPCIVAQDCISNCRSFVDDWRWTLEKFENLCGHTTSVSAWLVIRMRTSVLQEQPVGRILQERSRVSFEVRLGFASLWHHDWPMEVVAFASICILRILFSVWHRKWWPDAWNFCLFGRSC